MICCISAASWYVFFFWNWWFLMDFAGCWWTFLDVAPTYMIIHGPCWQPFWFEKGRQHPCWIADMGWEIEVRYRLGSDRKSDVYWHYPPLKFRAHKEARGARAGDDGGRDGADMIWYVMMTVDDLHVWFWRCLCRICRREQVGNPAGRGSVQSHTWEESRTKMDIGAWLWEIVGFWMR